MSSWTDTVQVPLWVLAVVSIPLLTFVGHQIGKRVDKHSNDGAEHGAILAVYLILLVTAAFTVHFFVAVFAIASVVRTLRLFGVFD
jgi:hypothetical protein